MTDDMLFEIATPLGFTVRCSKRYWEFIVSQKHPTLRNKEKDVINTLANPEEVRRSRKDTHVLLFYGCPGPYWLCVVSRRENEGGFLITAYPTNTIKAGEIIWKQSK